MPGLLPCCLFRPGWSSGCPHGPQTGERLPTTHKPAPKTSYSVAPGMPVRSRQSMLRRLSLSRIECLLPAVQVSWS